VFEHLASTEGKHRFTAENLIKNAGMARQSRSSEKGVIQLNGIGALDCHRQFRQTMKKKSVISLLLTILLLCYYVILLYYYIIITIIIIINNIIIMLRKYTCRSKSADLG